MQRAVLDAGAVEDVDRDPVTQFLNTLDVQFGELAVKMRAENGGSNRIIQTAQSGKFNLDLLKEREEQLRANGFDGHAQELARKARVELEKSAENVMALRSQTENMASLLLELAEHVEASDTELVKEVLGEVKSCAGQVTRQSTVAKAEYSNLNDEMMEKSEECRSKAEKCKWNAKVNGGVSFVSGTASAAVAVATPVAATSVVSVQIGLVGVTAVTICPVTLAVGAVAAGVCATLAFSQAKNAKCWEGKASSQKDMAMMAGNVADVVDINRNMWSGVVMAAGDLHNALEKVADMNPRRRRAFKDRVEEVSKGLAVMVDCLDEYIVWLSLCKYFPPNYPIDRKLGRRYHEIRAQLMDKDRA